MQRTFLIVLGLLMTCLGNQALAQTPPSAPGQSQAPAYTKVGVVNMGVVFSKYNRVQTFKMEMEKDAEPFKKKKGELDTLISQWKQAMSNRDPKNQLNPEQMEQGRRVLIDCNRRLEDLEVEFKKVVGKKLEDQMVMLNNEIRERIKAYAGTNGFHLVLAFGEPETPLPHLVEFQRRMKVIDQGGMTVAYFAPNIDISADIVRFLNSSYQPGPDPVNRSGVK